MINTDLITLQFGTMVIYYMRRLLQTQNTVHEFRAPMTLMMALSLLLIFLAAMLGYNVVKVREERYYSEEQVLIMKEIEKQNFLYQRAASFGFPTYGSLGDSNHSYKENGHDIIERREPVFHQPRLPEGVRSYVLIDEDLLP